MQIAKKVVLSLVALAALLLATPAEAQWWRWRPRQPPTKPVPRPAPEFDPAAAGAIATLLAGTGVLLRRRRR
jgi:hypothetical protein